MKNRNFIKNSILLLLPISMGIGVLFGTSDKHETEVSAYTKDGILPTTIHLKDNSAEEIINYYSALKGKSTDELQGNNLLKNLKPILKNGQKYYKYDNDSLWAMYEITDRDWKKSPADKIPDGYGTYDPTMKTITGYKYGSSTTADKGSNPFVHALYVDRSVDNLTTAWDDHKNSQWGINQEHIWPKSQGFNAEGAGGARGDPMHLWAGNSRVNQTEHNNHMYGFVDINDEKTINPYSAKGYKTLKNNYLGKSLTISTSTDSVFEPQDSDKGDIARAIFYMVARYNNIAGNDTTINQDNPNLALKQTTTELTSYTTTSSNKQTGYMGLMTDLLYWNHLDPVDEYEIHRNNLLFNNFTHNRNPFIDYPEWADYIWGKPVYNGRNFVSYSSTPTGSVDLSTDVINGFKGEQPVQDTVTSIEITKKPTKLVYNSGETLDTAGMEVKAHLSNGQVRTLSSGDYTVSPSGSLTTENNTVTVSYEGKTATFSIGVKGGSANIDVSSISLNKTNLTLEVGASDQLSATISPGDATIKLVSWSSSNSSVVEVSDEGEITAISAGNATITCSALDGSGVTATCTIIVSAPAILQSITLSGQYPTEFYIGDPFSSDGLVVTANYSDNTHVDVTDDVEITGYDMESENTQNVTVLYGDKSASYTIEVKTKGLAENEILIVASQQGLVNADDLGTYTEGIASVTFTKNDGIQPKYYTSTSAFRVYCKNTFTIVGTKTIQKIEFEMNNTGKNGTSTITANAGNFNGTVWTGESNNITFTIGGDTGQRNIVSIKITYDLQGEDIVTLQSISLSGNYKTTFIQGEEYDSSGLMITEHYNNGGTSAAHYPTSQGCTITGYNKDEVGEQTIRVDWNGVYTTYTVNVIARPSAKVFEQNSEAYYLVKDTTSLKAEDTFLIVGIKNNEYYAMNSYSEGNNIKCSAINATPDADGVIRNPEEGLCEYKLGGNAGNWTLKGGSYYLYAAGGTGTNNYLKGANNADCLNAQWTISLSSTNGSATIKTADTDVARHTMRFNLNGKNAPLFGCYAEGQENLFLYRYEKRSVLREYFASVDLTKALMSANSILDAACGEKNVTKANWTSVKNLITPFLSDTTSDDYNALMFGEAKSSELQGNILEDFLARYDLITDLYGYDKFITVGDISRNTGVIRKASIKIETNPTAIVVMILATTGLISIGGYFFFRRRKEDL